jgi:hypothetical protein
LSDGARVLTRTMKKIETQAGKLKCKGVIAIATASRHQSEEGEAKRKKQYRELLRYSRQILNDTNRVMMPAKKKNGVRLLCEHLAEMPSRVRQGGEANQGAGTANRRVIQAFFIGFAFRDAIPRPK